jgi:predicted AlkP superfamily pyrophosphatase or phosphodiesterase
VKRLAAALAAVVWAAAAGDAAAWGFTAHRVINARAVETLPEPVRGFYRANAAWLAEHSIDPDLARDSSADPDHFLDMDAFGAWPFTEISADEAEHLRRFGPEARAKGRLPWRLAEDRARLVAAFRAGDREGILRFSASIGHLIGDAHVPLHAALNHDGQLTGQKGLHNRWESELVERFRRQLEPAALPAAARPAGDTVALAFAVLRDSYLHSLEVLASDRASAGPLDLAETPEDDRYDDAYYTRMFEREAARVSARLAASASLAGSLWLSAWEAAGRPALDPAFRMPYVRGQARAVLVSLDGAGAEIVEDGIARGLMPRLRALRARGAAARGAMSALPTKTAPGHAALFTGAWGDRSGIVGNAVPVPGGSVLEGENGYSATPLTAEPIWFAAARQDLDAVVVTGTQVHPFGVYFDERRFRGWAGRRLTLFDGYQNVDAHDAVLTEAEVVWRPAGPTFSPLPAHHGEAREATLEVAGVRIDAWAYDDPADPAGGLDTLLLALDGDPGAGVALKAVAPRADASAFGSLTIPVAGGETEIYFRLHALAPDGSRLLLWRSAPSVLRSNKTRLESAALDAAGGFVGNGAAYAYEQGRLGLPLWQGGDGAAEARYLETAALVVRQFSRLNAFAFDRTGWDLLVTYLPYPDEALHRWYGFLDPTLPGHDPALAARLRPHADRVLVMVDEYLGRIEDEAGRGAIVAVGADHGMTSAAAYFKPNVVLARAGLLAFDASGRPDLARTKAVYFPGNSGYVLINRVGRPGGIVAPAEEEDVRRRVAAALTGFADPASGRPYGVRVLDVRTDSPATPNGATRGGAHAGDLFVELDRAGVVLSERTTGDPVEPRRPEGTHFQDPQSRRMHASFVIAGPGVASGADLGVIQQIDIAPTLAALLGMDPLAHAAGHPLPAAMAPLPVTPTR